MFTAMTEMESTWMKTRQSIYLQSFSGKIQTSQLTYVALIVTSMTNLDEFFLMQPTFPSSHARICHLESNAPNVVPPVMTTNLAFFSAIHASPKNVSSLPFSHPE
jgi:hypothetical protein